MIPEIITKKIYFYLWYMKQREICQEYKQNYEYNEIYHMVRTLLKDIDYNLNYRNGYNVHFHVHDNTNVRNVLKRRKITYLPLNYWYSSGMTDPRGWKMDISYINYG